MQVTIDSGEPLERVLPVINALYGVSLSLPDPIAPATQTETASGAPRRARSPKAPTGRQVGRRNKRAAVTAGAVREWARSNGYEVNSRGRLSAALLDAYQTAN